MERPSETLISIQQENRVLRWLTGVLCLAILGLVAAVIYKPAPIVWLVHERGNIIRSDGKVFTWGPLIATQRAFEAMFVPSENRADLIESFFEGKEKGIALNHTPNDRFVFFRADLPVSVEEGNVVTEGTLFRDGKDSTRMRVSLTQVNPSIINPMGLVISSVTVINR